MGGRNMFIKKLIGRKKEEKAHKLEYHSENLAVPEVHVDPNGSYDDEDIEPENGGEMIFENLAVPEIKLKKRSAKK